MPIERIDNSIYRVYGKEYDRLSIKKYSVKIYKEGPRLFYYKPIGVGGKTIMHPCIKTLNMIYSEIINSEIYRRLGLFAPKYYFATDDKTIGVLSENVAENYKKIMTLDQFLASKKASAKDYSLQYIKDTKNVSKKIGEISLKLDQMVLAHVGTGNSDGHFSNILVCFKDNNTPSDIALIDSSLSYPAINDTVDNIKDLYNHRQDDLKFRVGITTNTETIVPLNKIFYDIKNSKYISDEGIHQYLVKANELLNTDAFIEIKDRVADDYSIISASDEGKELESFMYKEYYVLKKTTEDIEKFADERTK